MTAHYRPLPPAEELWRMFTYEPLTGFLHWRISYNDGPIRAGMRAGSYKHKSGYVFVFSRYWGRHKVAAQRIVWKWVTGEDPGQFRVDHADLNKHNNRFWNLRLATAAQSTWNRPQFHFAAGRKLMGAHQERDGWGWRARIGVNGKVHHLGTFPTEQEAHDAYCEAVFRFRGEYGRTS